MSPGPFSIDHTVLGQLSADEAVQAFRDLLWARALQRGIPVTPVSISAKITTADGGIDASIIEDGKSEFIPDELLSAGRRFQIKTGNFKPWDASAIKRELFGKKSRMFESLGKAIQRTLREGAELVFVCFGVDPVDEQLRQAKDNLAAAFKSCRYPDARFDVWGQTQLIGLFQQYPALCLKLRGIDHQGFRFWSSWANDADMEPAIQYSAEQLQQVEDIRLELTSAKYSHIRLLGEPGVGKTRMAFEITRSENLAPATLYVRDGQTFLASPFLTSLIQGDAGRFAVIVVDECSRKDCAEIWNMLRNRSDNVRLITIDHGPDDSADVKTRYIQVVAASPEQITRILEGYGLNQPDASRWAQFCEGSPRVAHVVGDNLQRNDEDVLKAPGTVDVWNRFVVGRDDPASDEVQLRKVVLAYLSLFERFGFEQPVDAEAEFIRELVAECDPRLTKPKFIAVVKELRKRRIIQGATTLYITPRLLHIHFYRDFWQNYGPALDIANLMRELPAALQPWFITMFRYAGQSRAAQAAIEHLLGPAGAFPAAGSLGVWDSARSLVALTEANPKLTLQCLQRLFGELDRTELEVIRIARQNVVWALANLAVWDDCFSGSAELLLKLAELDDTKIVNNATGTFAVLFNLYPGSAPTQAPAARRLIFLRDVLQSDSAARRRIGLLAARSALSRESSFRTVGPEHQGLLRTIQFWQPSTYQELWDAYRDVWQLLVAQLTVWQGEDRRILIQSLIASAASLIRIPQLAPEIVDVLESLPTDPDNDVKALLEFIGRHLRYWKNKLPREIVDRLIAIRTRMDGHDFKSRLTRCIRFWTANDNFDDALQRNNLLDQKLEELACEAIATPSLLEAELDWLLVENSNQSYHFALRFGRHDANHNHLETLLSKQESLGIQAPVTFLCGYLASIYNQNVAQWESILESLNSRSVLSYRLPDLAISSGMSDFAARLVAERIQSGQCHVDQLTNWWFCDTLRLISESVFLSLIDVQISYNRIDLWRNAVKMFHNYYIDQNTQAKLPETETFRLLTNPSMAGFWPDDDVSYCWSGLSAVFVKQYPNRVWEFFRAILQLSTLNWRLLMDLEKSGETVLSDIYRSDPDQAWKCIIELLDERGIESSNGVGWWLSEYDGPDLIHLTSPKQVFDWVEKDVGKRSRWLIPALSRTLDHSPEGRWSREFVAKYGCHEDIIARLLNHFAFQLIEGSENAYYRKQREAAREWLVGEQDQTVLRWIENFIEFLGEQIRSAEIREEREE